LPPFPNKRGLANYDKWYWKAAGLQSAVATLHSYAPEFSANAPISEVNALEKSR
jgi:hypothetical protein